MPFRRAVITLSLFGWASLCLAWTHSSDSSTSASSTETPQITVSHDEKKFQELALLDDAQLKEKQIELESLLAHATSEEEIRETEKWLAFAKKIAADRSSQFTETVGPVSKTGETLEKEFLDRFKSWGLTKEDGKFKITDPVKLMAKLSRATEEEKKLWEDRFPKLFDPERKGLLYLGEHAIGAPKIVDGKPVFDFASKAEGKYYAELKAQAEAHRDEDRKLLERHGFQFQGKEPVFPEGPELIQKLFSNPSLRQAFERQFGTAHDYMIGEAVTAAAGAVLEEYVPPADKVETGPKRRSVTPFSKVTPEQFERFLADAEAGKSAGKDVPPEWRTVLNARARLAETERIVRSEGLITERRAEELLKAKALLDHKLLEVTLTNGRLPAETRVDLQSQLGVNRDAYEARFAELQGTESGVLSDVTRLDRAAKELALVRGLIDGNKDFGPPLKSLIETAGNLDIWGSAEAANEAAQRRVRMLSDSARRLEALGLDPAVSASVHILARNAGNASHESFVAGTNQFVDTYWSRVTTALTVPVAMAAATAAVGAVGLEAAAGTEAAATFSRGWWAVNGVRAGAGFVAGSGVGGALNVTSQLAKIYDDSKLPAGNPNQKTHLDYSEVASHSGFGGVIGAGLSLVPQWVGQGAGAVMSATAAQSMYKNWTEGNYASAVTDGASIVALPLVAQGMMGLGSKALKSFQGKPIPEAASPKLNPADFPEGTVFVDFKGRKKSPFGHVQLVVNDGDGLKQVTSSPGSRVKVEPFAGDFDGGAVIALENVSKSSVDKMLAWAKSRPLTTSCANGVCRALSEMGVEVPGLSRQKYALFPYTVFDQVSRNGLQYEGQKVPLTFHLLEPGTVPEFRSRLMYSNVGAAVLPMLVPPATVGGFFTLKYWLFDEGEKSVPSE